MNRAMENINSNTAEHRDILSTVDLLELLWRRRYPVCIGMMAGILLGLLYYVQATPKYESKADVLLVHKRPEPVTTDQRYESSFEDYVSTHRALIVSPLIVERAIESGNLGSLKTFSWVDPEEYDLSEVIIWDLEAGGGARELGENADSIMTLTFRGTQPEECPLVVQAILDSYKAFLDEAYRGMSDDAMHLIREARDLLLNDLQKQEEDYIQFRQNSPLVSRGTDEVNPLQDRLAAIETQRSDLLIRRAGVQGQLTAIENAKRNGYDGEQLLALVSEIRQRAISDGFFTNASATLDGQLIQLADQEQQLLEHYGPNHPHVTTIRERIATTRKLHALPTAVHLAPSGSNDSSAERDASDLYFQFLKQELDRIDTSEQLLTELYQREHDVAKELAGYQLKEERFQRNINRTQQLYDGIVSQLQEASLIKDFGGFEARVIAPPREGEQSSPSLKIVGPASVFVGLCLGFVLALYTEMKDKSLHSREEIMARLGWSVLGQIPRFTAASESESRGLTSDVALDPLLCTHFQPRSPQSRAIRALRTVLYFNQRDRQIRVVQLTGTRPGDGTSMVAANLAISLAQLGRRVLLLDADLQRPRQHRVFGISADNGLGSVIAAETALSEAICKTTIENLWLLPVGPVPPDCSELLLSPRFSEILESVRRQYDFVLVDSGPLLAVSDPGVIATQVDAVVLALRPTKDSRWRADQAKEILDTHDVKLMGVVVNGIGDAASRGYRYQLSAYEGDYAAPENGGHRPAN